MTEFKKKNKYNFWYSPLALVTLLGVLILFTYEVVKAVKKNRITSQKKELVLDQVKSLQQRENTLTKNIAKIQTSEGIESLIREKYQVVKKGEQMVIIINNKKDSQQPIESNKETRIFKLWNWLKNIF